MELEAHYDYLNFLDGKRRPGAPPGVVVEKPPARPARGRARDMLFIHLTLSSQEPATAALYQGVTETLASAYFLSGGSVTAVLRQAIRAANEFLMRHNLRVHGVKKQQGSVTCAVLREEEVFIAQAGTGLAFIVHQGQLERLPPCRPGHVTLLGVGYGVDTRFYHSWMHPGDVLLLAEPAFGQFSNEMIGPAVTFAGVAAGLDSLAQLSSDYGHARLILVEFVASAPLAPRVEPKAQEPPAVARRPARPAPAPAAPPEPRPSVELSPAKPQRPSVKIDVRAGARKASRGVALGLARLTDGIGQMLGRLFGDEPAGRQAVRQQDEGPSPTVLAIFAVVIPILVALVVVAVYMQRGRAAQFQDLLNQMQQESQQAQVAGNDKAAARAHWEQLLALSDEALLLRPINETGLYFREQARDELDLLDEITRLTVRSLYNYQGGGAPAALTMQNFTVYVLDAGLGHVYKHLLQSDLEPAEGMELETILSKNQAVGGRTVGELVDLVWFPKSGQIRDNTVTMLDAAGLLLHYVTDGPDARRVFSTKLVLPAMWSTPVATAVYKDNFYVLDIGARQVWRFEAQDGGYSDLPTTYRFADNEDGDPTNDIALGQMLDVAIDRDGNLYLLGNDGIVYKFLGGERKLFSVTGLQEPLAAPTAIFCSRTGLNPFFYIADPGSGRIVQTTQQGLFLDQYQAKGADLADPFAQIRDIYVQETPLLRLYATSGDSLIVASLE